MFHPSEIHLSQEAVENNQRFIQEMLGNETRFSSVVKGNAYGHGIEVFCPMVYESGGRHFSTFSVDEAYRVRQCLPKDITIMIMGYVESGDQLEWVIEEGIEFYVFDLNRLNDALVTSQKVGKPAKIHLELETGMNRTGLVWNEFKEALDLVRTNPDQLHLSGLCTHFAGAESVANYHRIQKQRKRFKRYVERATALVRPVTIHSACSAAAMRYPGTRLDLARIGILQYGFFPSREIEALYTKSIRNQHPLQRVISWKSRVMDIKQVKSSEFIGYGTSYLTNVDSTIAHVPVGYASGFARGLSNRGRAIIRGQRLPVVGMVNMNMMAVDCTGVNVEPGDEVTLIGKDEETEISVSSFGDASQLVNYELLTRLPAEIPRKIVKTHG